MNSSSSYSYDPEAARAFWHILVTIKPVFEDFRTRFIGKSSPVHFFWGSFDLASTRFSGRALRRDQVQIQLRKKPIHTK